MIGWFAVFRNKMLKVNVTKSRILVQGWTVCEVTYNVKELDTVNYFSTCQCCYMFCKDGREKSDQT